MRVTSNLILTIIVNFLREVTYHTRIRKLNATDSITSVCSHECVSVPTNTANVNVCTPAKQT